MTGTGLYCGAIVNSLRRISPIVRQFFRGIQEHTALSFPASYAERVRGQHPPK